MPDPSTTGTKVRQGSALNPLTHFILMPVFFGSFVLAIYLTATHRADNPVLYPWMIVLSLALMLLNMQTRLYSLRMQDRVIRLEERLRLAALLPREDLLATMPLTTAQLIGLRFASDAELPALARRTVQEGLSTAQIKDAVETWRPDNARI